jgi:hypothetical protein
MRYPLLAASIALLAACGDGVTESTDNCNTVALPLTNGAAGPTVTSVTLEVQPAGIVVLASATDPDGSDNLVDVTQSVGVFPDAQCNGTPIELQDDLAGSGVEESFGTAVDMVVNPTLYNTIASVAAWPVAVDFRDADGNRVTGRVMATVID